MARGARDAYFSDLARVNREIALRPVAGPAPGSVAELRVERLDPGSPVFTAGLRPGDRVLDVNGSPVDTLSRAVNLLHEIRASSSVTVTVDRQGRVLRFSYEID